VAPLNVLLTFDVEVWCDGWQDLDRKFPAAYRRYVYGTSPAGDFALPKTLETLQRHNIHAVFFVEPLFAARFGVEHLAAIVALIRDAGQEVQLHLHPEWTDEITPPPLAHMNGKRQHLRYYDAEEQTTLIGLGARLLQVAGAPRPAAFRAGGFAANRDTYSALERNGIAFDSSINAIVADSVPDLRGHCDVYAASRIGNVTSIPVTIFRDGRGGLRHAQVGACSYEEIASALQSARAAGSPYFVMFSHNFELLKPGTSQPDSIVAKRFERLCRHLGDRGDDYRCIGFDAIAPSVDPMHAPLPSVPLSATLRRYAEQALRRIV
jgi:hypothetical protein